MPHAELEKQKYLQESLADAILQLSISYMPIFSAQKNSEMCLIVVIAHLQGFSMPLCQYELHRSKLNIQKYMEGIKSVGAWEYGQEFQNTDLARVAGLHIERRTAWCLCAAVVQVRTKERQ